MALSDQSNIAGILEEFFRGRMLETHTALPGVVQSFNASKQEADIAIPFKRVRVDQAGVETEYDWPLLARVPVWMPHAGGFSITMPVAAGDECLVIFMQRDVSLWVDGAKKLPPNSTRVHDISDGVALVGLNSQINKVASYDGTDMQLRSPVAANHITIGADGSIAITGKDIVISDGTNDLLALVEDLIDALVAALVDDTNVIAPGLWNFDAATLVVLNAIKVKVTGMKP